MVRGRVSPELTLLDDIILREYPVPLSALHCEYCNQERLVIITLHRVKHKDATYNPST